MYILYPILARADIKKETNFYICDIFLVSEGDWRQKENGAFFVENDQNERKVSKNKQKMLYSCAKSK
jgi:hypothetical protein